ncbi:Ig-like domain-containing protein, partial [Marinoscillum furvescens]
MKAYLRSCFPVLAINGSTAMRNAVVFLLMLFFQYVSSYEVMAQATLDNGNANAAALMARIQGNGVTLSNGSFPNPGDATAQYGTFSNGISGASLSVDEGIILATGSVATALSVNDRANSSETTNNTYNDPDLTAINSTAIYDAAIFQFDITTGDDVDAIIISYQFGSEEYPDYVCSRFNDAFGFFVTGPGITGTQNIARVPESNNVVAVNSVNGGVCGSAADGTAADLTKSNYFIDNNEGTPGPIYVEFNGLTTLLNGKIEGLSPNTTYTFKIALADVGDGSFDSGVIINQVVGFKSNNDNDGLDDSADLDDDNDGIDDTVESFGNEPNGDEDGDGLENWRDVLDNNGSLGDGSTTDYTDADNNGFPDVYDSDGDEIPNHLDPDSDNDGCNDVIEAGFNDPDNDGVLGTSPVTSDANGRVTGEGGYSGTNSFVTTFNQQGALTAGPTAQSINEDQNVTFSVTATGDNLVYQWQENQGSGWANVTNGGTTPAYSGATSASLTLTGVPFAYNGYDYRLILTSTSNACTDTTSGAVNLEVINGPSEIPVITSEFCNASSENVTSVTGTTTEATTGLTIRIYTADTETGTKTQVTPSGVSFSGTTWTASGLSIAPGKWIFATAENVDELEPESDFSTGVQVITKTPDPGSTLQITSDPAEGDATLDGSVVSSTVNDLVIQLYVDGVAISGATTTVPQAGSPATVSWQITGLNTPTDKLYEGGVATVTMTYADAAYCESDPSPGVVIDCKPDVLIALGTVTDPNQCNTNTGSIQLTGLSGNTTYSVSYDDDGAGVLSNFTSNASGELVLNGLNAGTYTNIQVQTACPSNIIAGPITLSDPPTPAITFNNSNNPSNCGGSDGSIVIDGLSGSTSYTVDYKVDGVAVQRTISASGGQLTINNLSAGSYTDISVTLQGCQSNVLTGPYNLDDPFAPNISYNNDEQDPSSCSATDGYIRLRGLLAFQAYNYQYTKSGTVVNSASPVTASLTGVIEISNLEAGTYRNISVTPDGSTCQSNTIDQIVLNPPDISISASSNPTTCAGTEGSITLTGMASNTTYALNYKVDGVAATQTNITTDASGNYTISGLTEGSYAELNLSIGGCTTNNLSTTLTGPSPVTVAVEAINHPTTCGGSDGSVLVNGLAPSTTYTVNGTFNGNPVSLQQASDGNGKLSFTNLAAGSYTNFSVTKDNCQSNVIASVVLNDPDAPSITLVDTDVTVCQGTTSVGLSYSATTESPNRYYIDFDAAAEAQGFVDVDTTNLPVSPITLTVPVGAAAGSYNALLSVYNSSTNCGSAGTAITVNVSAYPAVPQINAQITNDQTPVISGTADANNDVEVQVGGATYNITANGSGNWSVDTETATPDAGAFNPNVNGVNEVVAIASNAAGCSTSDTSTNELTIDSTLPTVDIKNEPIRVNTTDPYNVTFSFSEAVTNFTLTDITVGNGTASNFVTVNDSTYTADITPNGTGDITIDVAAGVAQDAAGNDNTAATQAVTEYDVTAPTVDIQNEPAFVNSTSAYNVTIAFSEDVSGFTITDLNVGNGTASNFVTVDGSTYTVDITPDGTGDITIDVAAGVAQDAAGNDNTAATQAVTQYDDQAPTPVITGAPAYVTSNTPYDITVDFGEEVSGFVLSDLLVSNGTGSNLVDNTDGTYTITITPDGSGDLTYDINAGVATDAAGNSNNAATQVTTIYDASAPTVDIQDEPAIVNSTSPYTVTFSFNEDVTGFTLADIAVVNGAAGNFVTVNDSTYTADITPNGTGDITIDVAAGVAQDAAGNDNTAATQAVTEYDVTAPTVDIQNEPAFVNSTSAYNVTIAFSEDVSGF